MRAKSVKDRCTKRKLKKCEEIAKAYDKIQTAYADILDRDPDVKSIRFREFGCVQSTERFLKIAIFQ